MIVLEDMRFLSSFFIDHTKHGKDSIWIDKTKVSL